jgi:hypothetical protein
MIGSLGFVTVTTPATPVRATVNRPSPGTPADRIAAQTVRFQALPANQAVVYIGSQEMDKSTGDHVYAVIPAPASATDGPFADFTATVRGASAGLNVADFYIDADQAGDGVVVSYMTQ